MGGPAMAQSTDGPKADDPQETTSREVVVTATRTERELVDVPTSITVIDSKQIERRPQGTIAQLLQDIPGVQVTDGGVGGGSKRVAIRGEGPARVLVLIDGMKISEQKSMDGSMLMIDPNNVERIEVIKGPASVLYGSEAIGGVVNIITKKGGSASIQGTQAFTWDGSNGALIPYTTVFGKAKDLSYRVSGDYTDAGDKVGGSGKIENSGYMQRNWSAYVDYAFGKGKVGGGYDHYWIRNRVPVVASSEAGAEEIERNGRKYRFVGEGTSSVALDLPDWRRDRYYAFLELEKLSSTLRKVRLSPFLQNTKKDFVNKVLVAFTGYNEDMPVQLIDVDVEQNIMTFNDQTTYGLNLQTDWTFSASHYVIGGIDYIYDDLDATSENPGSRTKTWLRVPPGTPGFPPGGIEMMPNEWTSNEHPAYFYKGSQQTVAAYAQDEWSLPFDLAATIGLRWTSFNSELGDTNDDAPDHQIETRTDSGSNLVYSVGLVYSGLQNHRLRALVSTGYRYPLLNQLYVGTAMGSSGYCYPNPELKPETSNNFEVGARYDAHGIRCDVGAFYATAENYITITQVGAQIDSPEYTFKNVDTSKTYGAEATLSYTHRPTGLTPYLSGVWVARNFKWINQIPQEGGAIVEETVETDRTGLPRWNGSAGVRCELGSASSLSFHADAYGRFTARSEEDQMDESTRNTVLSYPGWATLNFAFGLRKAAGTRVSFFADVNLNNVLNKAYIPNMSTLEDPGFHAVVRAGLNF
jgi:hemoglobin/transferrin/lactoferrin receptor protein